MGKGIKMKFKGHLLALGLSVMLTACAQKSPFESSAEYNFALDWNDVTYRSDAAKKDVMREEQFRLNLLRVTDLRPPQERIILDDEETIRTFEPSDLVSGLESYVASSLTKYMTYPNDAEIQLGLEIDVKKFKTAIEYAFLQRQGQYIVDVEVEYLVRDEQSRVLIRDKVDVSKSVARGTFKGDLPKDAQDRSEMRKLLKDVMQQVSLDIGWSVHNAFDQQRKYYHPLKDEEEDFLDL